jgi:long-chain acyl-CoA synthetase
MRWFDPVGFVSLVEEHRVNQAALVPSMIQMLLTQPLEEHDLSCLERIGSGGAPLAVEVAHELERRVPGCEVREGYGCTETTALIARSRSTSGGSARSARPWGASRSASADRTASSCRPGRTARSAYAGRWS